MRTLLSLALLIFPIAAVLAEPSARLEQIIQRVHHTYAVERLQKAQTIRFEEDLRMEYESHDYGPEFHDLARQRRFAVLDLANQRGSVEYFTIIGSESYHGRMIFDGERARFIDYGSSMFEDQGDSDFATEFGGMVRASDVLLALQLVAAKDSAKHLGSAMWLGREHDLISIDYPNSPPLTLYVEPASGVIAKMTRRLPDDMVISYTFDDHKTLDGLTFAREKSVYTGRERLYFAFNRPLLLDQAADRSAFSLDDGVVAEPERLAQDAMTVEAVSKRAHHVGMADAYSTFVQTDEGLIAAGMEAGFAERLQAYREHTDATQALRYAIVTDHHHGEMSGVIDADLAGATLLVTAASEARLAELLADTESAPEVEIVSKSRTVGGLQIHSVATAHAAQVLIAYDPVAGFVFQSGHYISPYADQRFFTGSMGVTLADAIAGLKLEPKMLVSSGSRRIESWSDFRTAVDEYDATPCRRGRPICRPESEFVSVALSTD